MGSRRMCTARTFGTDRGRAGHSHPAFACLLPPARSQGANDNSRKLQASDVLAGKGHRRRLRGVGNRNIEHRLGRGRLDPLGRGLGPVVA
ncbi:protein of unknown function [Methylorubrum extorquens]|uniref:Uncharacterized protein n=1 Tax=Methylorubrum extorquens TaxID=408 RepID=A0A2N9AYQ3_METEX|nr:protein of unknown function [Methylorubrum extorquens]